MPSAALEGHADITWKKYPVRCDQWQKLQDLYRADMFPAFVNRRF